MYCGGGAGEDRERVVITHPPVTRNEQALRSKFLVTATALDLELTEDGLDMGGGVRGRSDGVERRCPHLGVLGLCWGMHRLGATWVLYRHSMTEGAHRLHPEDSLRCKWRASWRAWWRCW